MIVRHATHAMGTRFEFVLAGEDETYLHAVAEEAAAEVQLWHHRLNYFAPDSIVSRINAHAARRAVRVDDETFALLEVAATVHRESGGAFDVAVAPAMRAWGFREEIDPPAAFSLMRSNQPSVRLDRERRTVSLAHEGVTIDLGGIAKGFALDAAATVVRQHGVDCGLIHGGTSSVVAIGAPPEQPGGWRIAIARPDDDDRPGPVAVLRDAALGVSAPHGRMVQRDGASLGHVIDPRTSRPAQAAWTAAVVAPAATLADAWSTALVVLGERPSAMPRNLASAVFTDRAWTIHDASDGIDDARTITSHSNDHAPSATMTLGRFAV